MTDREADNSWERIRSEPGPELILFHARYDWYKSPRNGKLFKRVVLEASNWVNVVALTPEEKILVVRQFRFGAGRVTTEIPAGIVDPGEDSGQAAKRELLEETGFSTVDWKHLGWVEPNPAFLDNHCDTWLARNVVKKHAMAQEEGEDILVDELTLDEVRQEIREGKIRNALAIVALSHVFDLRGDW